MESINLARYIFFWGLSQAVSFLLMTSAGAEAINVKGVHTSFNSSHWHWQICKRYGWWNTVTVWNWIAKLLFYHQRQPNHTCMVCLLRCASGQHKAASTSLMPFYGTGFRDQLYNAGQFLSRNINHCFFLLTSFGEQGNCQHLFSIDRLSVGELMRVGWKVLCLNRKTTLFWINIISS